MPKRFDPFDRSYTDASYEDWSAFLCNFAQQTSVVHFSACAIDRIILNIYKQFICVMYDTGLVVSVSLFVNMARVVSFPVMCS